MTLAALSEAHAHNQPGSKPPLEALSSCNVERQSVGRQRGERRGHRTKGEGLPEGGGHRLIEGVCAHDDEGAAGYKDASCATQEVPVVVCDPTNGDAEDGVRARKDCTQKSQSRSIR